MAITGSFLHEPASLGTPPFFILGPCVMESEDFTWEMARAVVKIGDELGVQVVFKASYDKANRSASSSFRGPGPEAGRDLLKEEEALRFALS